MNNWRMFWGADVRSDVGDGKQPRENHQNNIWEVMTYEDVSRPLSDSTMKKLKI